MRNAMRCGEGQLRLIVTEQGSYLDDLLTLNGDNTSHNIMVPTEILGARIVNNISAEVQRPLKVW
jgi:glycine cleavage system aminomethyltransferase T